MRYYTFTYFPKSISNNTIFSLSRTTNRIYHSYGEIKKDMDQDPYTHYYSYSDWFNNEDLENQSINSVPLISAETGKVYNYKIVIREDHPAFNFEEFVFYFKSLKGSTFTTDRKLDLTAKLKDNVLKRLLLEVDVV